MINCKRSHLIQRCRERGYTYEEVSECVVHESGDDLIVDENHIAYPRHKKPAGLGDLVARGLSSIGITPERVSRLTGKPCGCNKRKQHLNELGKKIGIGNRRNTP